MRESTVEDYQQRLLRVLLHIQNHLDASLALDELADVAHFSPFHFHRIFRGMIGESVKEHVRRLRLERAAHRLRFTGQPVTEIAFDAGYQQHEAFTRAFRAMFEQSPTEFRKTHRAVAYGPRRPACIIRPKVSLTASALRKGTKRRSRFGWKCSLRCVSPFCGTSAHMNR